MGKKIRSQMARTAWNKWEEAGFAIEYVHFWKEGRNTVSLYMQQKKDVALPADADVLAAKLAKQQRFLAFSKDVTSGESRRFQLFRKEALDFIQCELTEIRSQAMESVEFLKQDTDSLLRVEAYGYLVPALEDALLYATSDWPQEAGKRLNDFVNLSRYYRDYLSGNCDARLSYVLRMTDKLTERWDFKVVFRQEKEAEQ